MKNDQVCIGFNLFFEQKILDIGTGNSKQKLEQAEQIVEQWQKLNNEEKMYWQQKEEALKSQINSKMNKKQRQCQTQEQKDIEEIQNNIQFMKFDEAKQNYKKRIQENLQQYEEKLDDDSKVQKIKNPQNSKKNIQRRKPKDDDDNFEEEEIKKGRKFNVKQSKRGGKRRM
ncbi:unnamed protein product (macronuclear) [Paramecium tetraurelia]|uniref:HMG box domain-containing protein n=1 Tax=Paramecium tetraurelia TaxID=5888 RepID=A0DM42_PARTE|nr:uncharacterized protein GSPATT00018327001 [Paramecium tetraurelia]CAK84109.1 unnamed protein product [Paramecium tetraurelia]|eukprot:XP_001451506.1 hypothetical protein (macronuclear) [Paramecium tetraurelia strain d4-2]